MICTIPLWVLFFQKILSTFVVSTVNSVWHNILWKCFSQVLKWKCGSFLVERMTRNNTHFRVDTCGRTHSARPDIPYLFECGVLCRLFSTGSFHNLHLDKRKSAPHLNRNTKHNTLIVIYKTMRILWIDTIKFPLFFISPNVIFYSCMWFLIGKWENNWVADV